MRSPITGRKFIRSGKYISMVAIGTTLIAALTLRLLGACGRESAGRWNVIGVPELGVATDQGETSYVWGGCVAAMGQVRGSNG